MKRREFLQLSTVTGGVLLFNSCEGILQENAPNYERINLVINPNSGFEIQSQSKKFGRVLFDENIKNLRKSADLSLTQSDDFSLNYDTSRNSSNLQPPLTELKNEVSNRFQKLQKDFVFESDIFILNPNELQNQNSRVASTNGWDVGGSVGDFYVRVSLEKHYLGGCIGQNVWHAGITINNNANPKPQKLTFDLHIASWKQNRDVCVGGYESKSGWCKKLCAIDTWRSIRDIVYAAIIAYVSYSVAIAIANFVATIALPVVLFA